VVKRATSMDFDAFRDVMLTPAGYTLVARALRSPVRSTARSTDFQAFPRHDTDTRPGSATPEPNAGAGQIVWAEETLYQLGGSDGDGGSPTAEVLGIRLDAP
jgi:hypothetical protein